MSERTETSVQKVGSFPSYLANMTKVDESLAHASQHRVVPRIACIQGLTPKEKRGGNPIGAAVLSPGMALFLNENESCLFTPLYLFTEFIQYRDRNDKTGPMVVQKSFEETSLVARKSRDPEARKEGYGPPDSKGNPSLHYEYVETRQFIVAIRSGRMKGEVCALSFQKGELFNGDALCSLLVQRKVEIDGKMRHVPAWMQVYEMKCTTHKNRKGNEWFGFDINNPSEGNNPFIEEEECPLYEKQYDDLHEKFKVGLLSADEGLGQETDPMEVDSNRHGM